ncbi:inositol polyphosphate 5-phosphatase [Cladochytrium tenue]|nr:inositol polyphosphate 5-phosphatase [Cladochytrium tenue]
MWIRFAADNPRAVALVPGPSATAHPSSVALVFQAVVGHSYAAAPRCDARFQPTGSIDLRDFSAGRPIHGCLGVVQVANDIFVAVVTDALKVDDIADNPVFRITRVSFFSLISNAYDEIEAVPSDPRSGGIAANTGAYDQDQPVVIHPCAAIAKILSSGSYFFSRGADLTHSLQAGADRPRSRHSYLDICDPRFFWNRHMLGPLLELRERDLSTEQKRDLDGNGMLLSAICGFVGAVDARLDGGRGKVAIVSRLSCRHAGTRYNARGVDDDGNVSNFVEVCNFRSTVD